MQAHIPVMLEEVLGCLKPTDGEVYVDGTFGAGGYTQAFLEAADCTVIAIDRDPSVQGRAQEIKQSYGDRFIFVQGCFGDALELVHAAGYKEVDGFVVDVGVSSMQIDTPGRGFSFREDGPLDMRMDPETAEISAADIVNGYEESDLANLIYEYGQEKKSRQVARKIVLERQRESIQTTGRLADIVRSVVRKSQKDKIDPATRTFQALRIAVNDEIGELRRGLVAAESLLKAGGRLVAVSFHSLEDGIVKGFLYERSGRTAGQSRHLPSVDRAQIEPSFELIGRKALEASEGEVLKNSRSRSAKLRAAIRTEAPVWSGGEDA